MANGRRRPDPDDPPGINGLAADATRVAGVGFPADFEGPRHFVKPVMEGLGLEALDSARGDTGGLGSRAPASTPGIDRIMASRWEPEPHAELQDSLQGIVGGGVNVKRNTGLKKQLALGYASRSGNAVRITKPGERNTVENSTRHTLQHEFGHVADFRNTFPYGESSVKEAVPPDEPRYPFDPTAALGNMIGNKGRESFAISFQRLFSALQSSDATSIKDFSEKNRVTPAERPLLIDMLNSQTFSGHSLTGEARAESMARHSPDLPQDATAWSGRTHDSLLTQGPEPGPLVPGQFTERIPRPTRLP